MKNLIVPTIAVLIFLTGTESLSQVRKMTAQDLTKESSVVLYGKCSGIKCEWNETRDLIFTYITIVPEEYLKGNLGAAAVITVPGGRVGDIIYEVSDMPMFTVGEELAAFIWTNPAGKNLVVGGFQGKMKIEKDSNTGKRVVKGRDKDSDLDSETLESFITKVKGYVKN